MTAALMPHRGALRALRGGGLAAVNAVLAVAAHVAGGGGAPDGALTVLMTVGVAAAGTALADRRRGPLALLTAVAVTQVVLHLLLDGLSGHHHSAAAHSAAAHSAAAHAAHSAAAHAAHSAAAPASAGTAMLMAHAAAVLVTAALLAGAESALFTVAGALRRIAGTFLLVQAPSADRQPTTPPITAPLSTALRRLLCRATPMRGPPGLR